MENYDPTIEDSYRKIITVKGKKKVQKSKSKPETPQASGVTSRKDQNRGILSSLWRTLSGSFRRGDRAASAPVRRQRPASMGDFPVFRGHKTKSKMKVQKADTNVLLLSMKDLEDESDIATGDPVTCKKCQAVLSCVSNITQEEDKTKWIW